MYESLNNYDTTIDAFNSINKKFSSLEKLIPQKKCFLGFDGYIDSLYSLVQSRENSSQWMRMESMKHFRDYIDEVKGSSANIERVLKRRISGGFVPNTCKALNALGMNVSLMAAIGYPKINDVFTPLVNSNSIEAIPISNPGETVGLEFDDGKIMLTDFENIFKIDWDLLMERVGLELLSQKLELSDIMGFGHWSLIQELGEIWKHLLDDIFPSINIKNSLFFVDLADIKKRSRADIIEMLNILGKIEEFLPVLLSLNDQEAIDVSKALDGMDVVDSTKSNHSGYFEGGKDINKEISLSYLVIHSPHFATITTKSQEHYWVTEGFTSKPKFTTGAGDHFHSGAVVGLCCGLNPAEAILLGNALTAIFVRTGRSPNLEELEHFTRSYLNYIERDNPEFTFS